ncbi:iron chelate uptake ABC transporter family permease subunit [Caulobacter sp. CCNWLY153]|uniref:FecCD family ABC transporter permease n=1 Tax=unclassified Caulobacter TaxID=2648921 RepID=UPI002FF0D3D9
MRDRASFRVTASVVGPVWRANRIAVRLHPRTMTVTLLLALLTLGLTAGLLTMGRFEISLSQIAEVLFSGGGEERDRRIVLGLRLPRATTGFFVGAALGVSGAVFQSVSRNPLGSPDVIGFMTGSATGAIAWIILVGQQPLGIAAAAVCGGLAAAVIVYLLSLSGGRIASDRLVLIGIGVGATLGALNGLLLSRGQLDSAVLANLWLAGSLNARTWDHVVPVMMAVIVLTPLAMALAPRLAIMEMGDDLARQLGIPVDRTRLFAVATGVILAALATGAAGPIAFIALAAPQLAKRLSLSRGVPIATAALMGGSLVLVADLVTQALPLHATLPIGRMTGLIGGVYFLWLLSRSRTL